MMLSGQQGVNVRFYLSENNLFIPRMFDMGEFLLLNHKGPHVG